MTQGEAPITRPAPRRAAIDDLIDRRLSRRSILRFGAAGVVGLTVGSLFSACGGDDDDDEPEPVATTAPPGGQTAATATPSSGPPAATSAGSTETTDEEPTATTGAAATAPPVAEGTPGGSLTIGLASEPDTMDQHVGSNRNNELINSNIYDRMLEYDADGEYAPGLVESWEVSDDGLAYTLVIKSGVSFHDATPLDAEAVKFSYDRIANPDTNSQKAVGLLGPYGGTEVVDDLTVTVTMTELYAGFIDALASFYLVVQSPAAIEQFGPDYGQNPVGTGPFIFDEWIQRDKLTLVRNPDYNWGSTIWDHEGPAYLESITYRFIAEAATRVTTLETGETDGIAATPLQDFELLNSDSAYTITMAPVLGQPPSMIVNTEKFPTDDILVREAIQYAVNQDEIIEVIYYGVYERAFGPLTQYNRYYDPAVEGMYAYDPDRAIELLEEAGWTLGSGDIREKDGQELNLVYLIFPGSEGLAELVQAQLRSVGIGIEVLALNNPANLTAAQNGEHNVRWLNWLFSDAGELSTTFHSENIGTGWNFARWRDAELDRLLDEGRAESDDAARTDIYSQIQQMVLEQSLIIPMYIGAQVVTTRSEVKGLRIHKLGDTPLFYDVYLDE